MGIGSDWRRKMKLKIYNETWEVKEIAQEEFIRGKDRNPDDLNYGQSNDAISTIFLLKTLGKQRKRSVLRHELGHAIVSMFQLANVDVSEEYMVSFAAAHHDEIDKVVKEYFKPKKKRAPKRVTLATAVPAGN